MSAELKIRMKETVVEGEVPTYTLTFTVVDAVGIDPNIFVIERTKPNLSVNKVEEAFHHVAYLYDMKQLKTISNDSTHQFIRRSTITRTYLTLDRLNESKHVMLSDISALLKAVNQLDREEKESEILVTAAGYSTTVLSEETYTFNGEEVII